MEEGNFPCPQCPKKYKFKTSLKRHLKYECGVERQFQCEICLQRFSYKSSLLKHKANKHTEMYQNIQNIQ